MPGADSSGRVFRVVFMEKQWNKAFQTVRLWKQEHRARLDIPGENEKPRFLAALKNVRPTGLEPVPIAGHAPQTCAYANSATVANGEATEDIIKNLPDFVKTYVRYPKYFLGR